MSADSSKRRGSSVVRSGPLHRQENVDDRTAGHHVSELALWGTVTAAHDHCSRLHVHSWLGGRLLTPSPIELPKHKEGPQRHVQPGDEEADAPDPAAREPCSASPGVPVDHPHMVPDLAPSNRELRSASGGTGDVVVEPARAQGFGRTDRAQRPTPSTWILRGCSSDEVAPSRTGRGGIRTGTRWRCGRCPLRPRTQPARWHRDHSSAGYRADRGSTRRTHGPRRM